MLTHIVFFRLKDRSDASRAGTRDLILSMRGRIPSLSALEAGADIVRSERSFDAALLSRFETTADFEAYRVHPVHMDVAKELKARSESVVAVDYES